MYGDEERAVKANLLLEVEEAKQRERAASRVSETSLARSRELGTCSTQ